MYVVKKSSHNPIFTHNREHVFEAFAAFNMNVVLEGDTYYGIYRAESAADHLREPRRMSTIGIAKSADGVHFNDRTQFIAPTESWDHCGCEDPRTTLFEGVYYTFYTALSGYPFTADTIKVGVALGKKLGEVDEKHLVTPFNAKAMMLFPERVGGKITVVVSVNTDRERMRLAIAQMDRIEELWDETFWNEWYTHLEDHSLDIRRHESDYFEGGAVPIKTDAGWLFIYSYIQHYHGGGDRIFGIEALLLDAHEPRTLVARTHAPIIVPTEDYEIVGPVENVLFPSGALLQGNVLTIYYGVTDWKTCLARVDVRDLLMSMQGGDADHAFTRMSTRPILAPTTAPWESRAVFNPGALVLDGRVHILYRAQGSDNTSTIGYAVSTDGIHIDERLAYPVYVPREDFEMKKRPNDFSGCEDPRLVQVGEDIYMFYTAYTGVDKPQVAVTRISASHFLARKWRWDTPTIISPAGLDDKDTCLFPKKIDGKYFVIHRINNDVCGDYVDSLDFAKEKLNECIAILSPRVNMWDAKKVGIATQPLLTDAGWLVLYHGVANDSVYRMGAVLLDADDPSYVLARTTDPLFEPELAWEKTGIVNNVVFPCGAAVLDEYLYIYYGGADMYTGVARIRLAHLLAALSRTLA